VRIERELVENGGSPSAAVQVTNLRKVYARNKVAVADLSFKLEPGECFGLLGVNGAWCKHA
jgi:lipooligosaccharide transport system ATP-binding protein